MDRQLEEKRLAHGSEKPVKNADLWCRLDQLVAANEVSWNWIKGHSGHPDNERADQLANRGITSLQG